MAEAYPKLPRAPRRSILFLAVTAEEYGLLGARYYAEHPLWPLERTLANVNMDVMNPWGRTRAIVNLGQGQSTLDGLLAEEAARQGRRVVPDPEAEKGYYYRSDHFELARKGVPALGFLFPGADYVDKPADFGDRKRKDYVSRVYHTPLDAPMADWDLEGAVEDTRLLFRVGLRVAEGDTWPAWNPGTEFRARRDAMLGGGRDAARKSSRLGFALPRGDTSRLPGDHPNGIRSWPWRGPGAVRGLSSAASPGRPAARRATMGARPRASPRRDRAPAAARRLRRLQVRPDPSLRRRVRRDGAPCFRSDPHDCVAITCAEDRCQPVDVPDGTLCLDGNGCTVDDACTGGTCSGAPKTCAPGQTCAPATGTCG